MPQWPAAPQHMRLWFVFARISKSGSPLQLYWHRRVAKQFTEDASAGLAPALCQRPFRVSRLRRIQPRRCIAKTLAHIITPPPRAAHSIGGGQLILEQL